MRHFVDQHLGRVLYLIRIPTRFAMIYLGSTSANLHTAALLLALSLCLIAWAYDAPLTLLKTKYPEAENFRTGDIVKALTPLERFDRSRALEALKHISLGVIMAATYYVFGRLWFVGVFVS